MEFGKAPDRRTKFLGPPRNVSAVLAFWGCPAPSIVIHSSFWIDDFKACDRGAGWFRCEPLDRFFKVRARGYRLRRFKPRTFRKTRQAL